MAKQTLNVIKNWFKTGLKPSQQQFLDTWDSFWHKDDTIPAANIENLDKRFDEKADQQAFVGHLTDVSAHGINNKVDKEAGKGLSSNDYTDGEKQKLANLYNYDDTDMQDQIDAINQKDTAQDVEIDGLKDLALTINSKENIITPGTKAQYFRGDKTWQVLDKKDFGLGNLPTYSGNYRAIEAGLTEGDFYRIPDVLGNYLVAAVSLTTALPLVITLNIPSDNYTMADGTLIYSTGRIDYIIDYGDGYTEKNTGTGIQIRHTYSKAGIYKISLATSDNSKINSFYMSEGFATKMENLSGMTKLLAMQISKGSFGYFNTKVPPAMQSFSMSGLDDNGGYEVLTGIDMDIFSNYIGSFLDFQIYATALKDIDFKTGLPASSNRVSIASNKNLTRINLDIFKNCINIKQIDLSENKKLALVDSTIKLPASLERFSLQNSKVSAFNPDLFKNCLRLSILEIDNNNFTSFSPIVSLPKGLKELLLKGNKFSVEEVNNILTDLDKLEFTKLTVTLNNQNPPAAPTGAGLVAKNNLIAKGFSITTDE